MSDFHYRSSVMSAARNLGLLVRPGVMLSWFTALRDGDLFLYKGEVVRCSGVARSLTTQAETVRFTSIDGRKEGALLATDRDRVEKLDLIGYSDVVRFLEGRQPQFIRDVEHAFMDYVHAQDNVVLGVDLHDKITVTTISGESFIVPARRMTPAQRERARRDTETPAQADERRRKNRENMRRKRAIR